MKEILKTSFLLFFLLFGKNSFAYFSSISDSLEAILIMDVNEQQKINTRNQLAKLYLKYNVNKAVEYVDENLASSNLVHFPKSQAITFYIKGRANLLMANTDEAEFYLNKASKYFSKHKMFKELGDCYKDLGSVQLDRNNYSAAKKFYSEGIIAYQKGNYDAGLAHCNLNLGNVYITQFLYPEGIQYYYNALKKYEDLGMHRYMGMCNNNIGNIYKDLNNFPKAYEHYKKASEAYLLDKDSIQIVNVNLNIGATYLDEEKYDQAIQILYKTLEDTKSIGFNPLIPVIYNNLASCHINLGNYDLAEKNNRLAIKYAQLNNNKLDEFQANFLISEIYLRRKKYTEAILLAQKTYAQAKKYRQVDLMADILKVLYTAHKSVNHFEQSLHFLELYNSYQDSLFNEDRLKLPLSKDFEYKLKKQKREQTIQQEKEKLAYESSLAFKNLMLYVLGIGLLVLGFLAFVMYQMIKAKRLAERELENKNKVLKKYIESNIQLEQFAHIASHDLKSPLRTVGSFSSLLKRRAASKLNENELEYLDMISNAAKLMWNLVDDLMVYSQVNALQMNLESKNVNSLLNEVIANLDFSIKEKNAIINISQMPQVAMVDETKIRQVFQNLIANSLKFMPAGTTPKIKIDCKEEGNFWKFSVQDNGIGISEDYHDKIFKPYQQLHTKDKFEGTGMGLAICKKIIEKHGGTIYFESKIGEGTTFFFTILKAPTKKIGAKELEVEMMA